MTESKINSIGKAAEQAFKDLHSIQKGRKHLLKTGEPMIDSHVGCLLVGDVVVISASPGDGKTHTLHNIIEQVLSKEVNSNADNIVSLEFNLELRMLNIILRKTHERLGKKKSEILFNTFTKEEAEKVKKYYEELQDGRRFIVQEPVTPLEFYEEVKVFAEQHKDKDAILISVDHLLLLRGSDKQKVLEDISEYVNLLKLQFNNLYFILLSQNNRTAYSNIKEKSNDMRPTNSWIYGSSFMEQLASYIIIQANPFKKGILEYLSVYPDRYDYLQEYQTDINSKGKCSFHTATNIFFFVTKMRDSDDFSKDLFIKKMNLSDEQKTQLEKQVKENKNESQDFPPIPEFDNPFRDLKPIDTTTAFGYDPPF